jgi:membrane protein YqaA with SNARE-associated domain
LGYFGLFFSSFISATLLPGGSEALLVYLLNEKYTVSFLLLSATLGNTLGSFTNYLLGKYGITLVIKYRYIQEASLQKAERLFETYGSWSLFFSWLPFIGDPLTLVAGALKYTWWKFLGIVTCAKLTRYVVVYLGFLAVVS